MASRKIFVGSLPPTITGDQLKEVFSKYGTVEETYVKPDCEPGRQWAFVTFSAYEEAQYAKECCDRQVTFPGSAQPSDVMLAKSRAGKGGEKGGFGGYVPPPAYGGQDSFNQPALNGGSGGYVPPPAYGGQDSFNQPALDGGGGGYVPPPAYGGQAGYGQPASGGYVPGLESSNMAPRKVFVGSLPGTITDDVLRQEFSQYGSVEDIFIKPNCEPGRQWAFVNFASSDQAAAAAAAANGVVQFAGCVKPCEVTLARNQGMFGQDPITVPPPHMAQAEPYVEAPQQQAAPRKIFVGSLPDGITDPALRAEFSKYGTIVDLYMKNNCEPGRHWAFITYATHEEAAYAKDSCDRVLQFPGADRPCEVTIARHQGMFGKDAVGGEGQAAPVQYSAGGNYSAAGSGYYNAGATFATPAPSLVEGPRKIFVGSLPDGIDDAVLKTEFSKYGQIVDLFIKRDSSERNRQWAFVTFASAEQAAFAKESTDRVLLLPGADRACEVMLAKNQGKFGQAPLGHFGVGVSGGPVAAVPAVEAPAPAEPVDEGPQPPPPAAPPPAHLTAWRMYRTASGLPYYYNSGTGITQWECPPDLQLPGQPPGQPPPNAYAAQQQAAAAAAGQQRSSPY